MFLKSTSSKHTRIHLHLSSATNDRSKSEALDKLDLVALVLLLLALLLSVVGPGEVEDGELEEGVAR